jgi:hypothetical protein
MRGIRILTAGLLAMALAAPAMAQQHPNYGRDDRGGWGDRDDRGRGDRDRGGWNNDRGGVRIEGISVDAAKRQLRSNGYYPARSISLDGRQWDLWSSGRSCVGFASYKGTVTNSERFDERGCAYGFSGRGPNDRGGYGQRRFEARELVGLSVDEGKRELSYAGYRGARSISLRNQQWDLWRNGGSCVGFTSWYGRITDVDRFPEDRCR